ncbi:hypothetical protein YK48G_04520 [Lentilactobacillus fungorum]|uniref:t-SNARE coiled-coil homology domain-containing protein n=1 Tax=Lentilactobacillus fungorum TaxID=2201250 RepID=A0ABQ3VVV8_9LACO|nr:hypothetical protein [Lentilactobacillus fungorum]GHP13027.1 hypothetical protein YK48G_04520 [Lentilactobacillus fungorum]
MVEQNQHYHLTQGQVYIFDETIKNFDKVNDHFYEQQRVIDLQTKYITDLQQSVTHLSDQVGKLSNTLNSYKRRVLFKNIVLPLIVGIIGALIGIYFG